MKLCDLQSNDFIACKDECFSKKTTARTYICKLNHKYLMDSCVQILDFDARSFKKNKMTDKLILK